MAITNKQPTRLTPAIVKAVARGFDQGMTMTSIISLFNVTTAQYCEIISKKQELSKSAKEA